VCGRDKGSEPHHTARRRTDGKGKDGTKDDTTGKGPTLVKRRKTKGSGIQFALLIRVL
jgi:hypothetical protein